MRIKPKLVGMAVVVLVAGAFAAQRFSDSPSDVKEMDMLETVLTPNSLVDSLRNSARDSLAIYMPSFDVLPAGIAIVEPRRNRVSLMSKSLAFNGHLGQEGEGPGDLRLPMSVRSTLFGFVVMEGGNKRASYFNKDGVFERTVSLQGPSDTFGVDAAGNLYTTSVPFAYYATVTDSTGRSRPIGRRLFRPIIEVGIQNPGLDMVAITNGGHIHVFDNQHRVLLRFDTTGTLTLARRLPALVEQKVKTFIKKTDDGFRKANVDGTVAALKEFRTTSDGNLFIRYQASPDFALLINPESYVAQQIVLPTDSILRRRLQTAYTMTVHDSVLVAMSMEGEVDVYALPRRLPAGSRVQ